MRLLALFAGALLTACVTTGPPPLNKANPKEAARLNTQLGIEYLRDGRFDLAREKLERAIEQDSRNSVAHSFLAFLHSRSGETKLAERHFQRALSLDNENPDTLSNFGIFLCGQGRREEAEQYFIRAANAPQYTRAAAAYTNAGVCLLQHAPERAEFYLREALRTNPEFGGALAQMASLSLRRGDYLRARAFLQRYEAGSPHIAETLWIGVQTERELGDEEAAERYARMLRENVPESDEAQQLGRPS